MMVANPFSLRIHARNQDANESAIEWGEAFAIVEREEGEQLSKCVHRKECRFRHDLSYSLCD
jgi:hypothetical protein